MHISIRFAAIFFATLLTAPAGAQESSPPMTEEDKLSYALAARIGRDLRDRSTIEIKPEHLFKGIDDALTGRQLQMSEQDISLAMNSLRQKVALAAQERAEENRLKGAEFLAANKKQESVVTLKSGLQYKILKRGDGPKPAANDRVVVNYRGTLIDGTEFDSSYARKEAATFTLRQGLKGWSEVLLRVRVGSTWQ